ncbi:DUF742 domain-containing protein [Streptomyces sp. NPDC001339]|uniref:DUF742 domain-containing protein n=1 Tax=Streptomyces sp. NPDC001339 TaxID=3364563 RepID=UPI003682871A
MSKAGQDWDEGGPERLYVITGGRSQSDQHAPLDLVTLIVAKEEAQLGMQPEFAAILRICRTPLSVAEISAHLALPASVVGVLLHDLLADGRVEARAPAAQHPDIALIEAVIHGLQKL